MSDQMMIAHEARAQVSPQSRRVLALAYGLACYLIFLVTFLYAIAFIDNLIVPKSIDTGVQTPIGQALIVNLALLALFAVQHSAMARVSFKRRWTRIVPKPVERSTFVLLSSLALLLLFWQWRAMPVVVWSVESSVLRMVLQGLYLDGWLIVLLGSFMINHFDLFGLRQVYLNLRDQESAEIGFTTPFLYQFLRHPMMLGFLIVFWSEPEMTLGHFLFSAAMTVYIWFAVQLEENDLVSRFGDTYREYRRRTPRFFPRLGVRKPD